MRSIKFRLALLIGGAALLAVAAAAGLVVALRVVDRTLDRALDAQRRLDLLAEVSGRLTEYGLAAVDETNATTGRGERLRDARWRVEAAIGAVEGSLTTAVAEAEGVVSKTETAARSRPLAQLKAGFAMLDRQITRTVRQEDAVGRVDAIRGAFNGFAASSGPYLSFLVQAERRAVEAAREAERQLSTTLIRAALFAGLLALAAAIMMHRLITRPILARLGDIRRAAVAIGRGELGMRLAIGSRDELGLVAAAFNRMAARLSRRESRIAGDRAALEQTIAQRTADLTAANARLEEADRSRRRFFADVSHELRTPLTVILGECDIALRQAGTRAEQYRSSLGIVRKRAQRLHRRVEDLLRVARSESGRIELNFRQVALTPLLTAAIDSFDTTARHSSVEVKLAAPTEDIEVTADGEWLRQIVEGLIDNALRHAKGASEIVVALADLGAEAEIAVSDNGCGIAATEREALFARFARTERGEPGFGIGLALARWVVEEHRGTIAIEPGASPAGGAKIVVRLAKTANGDGH